MKDPKATLAQYVSGVMAVRARQNVDAKQIAKLADELGRREKVAADVVGIHEAEFVEKLGPKIVMGFAEGYGLYKGRSMT